MEKQIINTPSAPAPIGPYNQAILAGDMLFYLRPNLHRSTYRHIKEPGHTTGNPPGDA